MFISQKKLETFLEESFKNALAKGDNDKAKILNLSDELTKLKEEKSNIKAELAELKQQKELEKMKIEHLVKMREEKNAIELEKAKIQMQSEFQEKTMELQKENHQSAVSFFETGKKEMKELYEKIMDRLPNVNMAIKQKS